MEIHEGCHPIEQSQLNPAQDAIGHPAEEQDALVGKGTLKRQPCKADTEADGQREHQDVNVWKRKGRHRRQQEGCRALPPGTNPT